MTELMRQLARLDHICAVLLTRLKMLWSNAVSMFKNAVLNMIQNMLRNIAGIKNGIMNAIKSARGYVRNRCVAGLKAITSVFYNAWDAISNIHIPKIKRPQIKLPQILTREIHLPKLKKDMFINHAVMNVCLVLFLVVGGTGVAKSMPMHYKFLSGDGFGFRAAENGANITSADEFIIALEEPAAGDPLVAISAEDDQPEDANGYRVEENTLNLEGVLVPQKTTVISSSRDGQIEKVNFDNGDIFEKGDTLIAYVCEDLKAEMEAVEAENALSIKKGSRGEKLFKLEIISEFEKLDLQNELSKANAQKRILEARMKNCSITAAYDGRVVNRLANDNEYTRTDRVLMEVASLDDLDVEFLLPSKWLRWVNIGAPLTLTLFETDREYSAQISRIHGEVDPVSQSIQITATLDQYDDPLLPGMSGNIVIDVDQIRNAGVRGYLQREDGLKIRYE